MQSVFEPEAWHRTLEHQLAAPRQAPGQQRALCRPLNGEARLRQRGITI